MLRRNGFPILLACAIGAAATPPAIAGGIAESCPAPAGAQISVVTPGEVVTRDAGAEQALFVVRGAPAPVEIGIVHDGGSANPPRVIAYNARGAEIDWLDSDFTTGRLNVTMASCLYLKLVPKGGRFMPAMGSKLSADPTGSSEKKLPGYLLRLLPTRQAGSNEAMDKWLHDERERHYAALRTKPATPIAAQAPNPVVASAPGQRGYLGLRFNALDAEIATALGLPDAQGTLVSAIEPDGSAARAGVRVGDVIRRVDGQPVRADRTLPSLIANRAAGALVKLEIFRDGRMLDLQATLSDQPIAVSMTQTGGDMSQAQTSAAPVPVQVAAAAPVYTQPQGVYTRRGPAPKKKRGLLSRVMGVLVGDDFIPAGAVPYTPPPSNPLFSSPAVTMGSAPPLPGMGGTSHVALPQATPQQQAAQEDLAAYQVRRELYGQGRSDRGSDRREPEEAQPNRSDETPAKAPPTALPTRYIFCWAVRGIMVLKPGESKERTSAIVGYDHGLSTRYMSDFGQVTDANLAPGEVWATVLDRLGAQFTAMLPRASRPDWYVSEPGKGRCRIYSSYEEASEAINTDRDMWVRNTKNTRNPRDIVLVENIMWRPVP